MLVGSGSIAKNELIAAYLDKQGIKYELLNAKNNEREAAIVEQAGQKGAITLATNIAGRGTDIKLGEGVRELGGLVVIGSGVTSHAASTTSCVAVAVARVIQVIRSFMSRPRMT